MADTENGSEAVAVESKIDDTKVESKDVTKDAEPIIEPKSEVSKDLQAQIIKQVEYYFGDANLARDKFLSEEITKDNGWITLELLLKFKRMQALTSDAEVVCAALDTSDEGLIEISEDRLKLRRHPERPLPEQNEETRKECITRTAYVKGFPLEAEMSELIEFFDNYDKVVNIVMRKYMDKPTKVYKFKGSVFVTFQKKEQCEEFMKKEEIEYKDVKLIKMWQDDYYASKKGEREEKKQKKIDEKPAPKITLPKGAVIFFEGCSDKITRELIKEAVSNLDAEVAYIDYTKGDSKGYIRLSEENSAKSLIDKLENNKLKIDDEEACVRLIEGDEETEYLTKQVEQMLSRRTNFISRNRGGRGNRYQRKRPGSQETNDTPSKVSKDAV